MYVGAYEFAESKTYAEIWIVFAVVLFATDRPMTVDANSVEPAWYTCTLAVPILGLKAFLKLLDIFYLFF
jgi:hypothetical protein